MVGVPYSDEMIEKAKADLLAQVDPNADAAGLVARYPGAVISDHPANPDGVTEIDALVAYLQMLGTSVKFRDVTPADLRQ